MSNDFESEKAAALGPRHAERKKESSKQASKSKYDVRLEHAKERERGNWNMHDRGESKRVQENKTKPKRRKQDGHENAHGPVAIIHNLPARFQSWLASHATHSSTPHPTPHAC
jgi:hypothetical protein